MTETTTEKNHLLDDEKKESFGFAWAVAAVVNGIIVIVFISFAIHFYLKRKKKFQVKVFKKKNKKKGDVEEGQIANKANTVLTLGRESHRRTSNLSQITPMPSIEENVEVTNSEEEVTKNKTGDDTNGTNDAGYDSGIDDGIGNGKVKLSKEKRASLESIHQLQKVHSGVGLLTVAHESRLETEMAPPLLRQASLNKNVVDELHIPGAIDK